MKKKNKCILCEDEIRGKTKRANYCNSCSALLKKWNALKINQRKKRICRRCNLFPVAKQKQYCLHCARKVLDIRRISDKLRYKKKRIMNNQATDPNFTKKHPRNELGQFTRRKK